MGELLIELLTAQPRPSVHRLLNFYRRPRNTLAPVPVSQTSHLKWSDYVAPDLIRGLIREPVVISLLELCWQVSIHCPIAPVPVSQTSHLKWSDYVAPDLIRGLIRSLSLSHFWNCVGRLVFIAPLPRFLSHEPPSYLVRLCRPGLDPGPAYRLAVTKTPFNSRRSPNKTLSTFFLRCHPSFCKAYGRGLRFVLFNDPKGPANGINCCVPSCSQQDPRVIIPGRNKALGHSLDGRAIPKAYCITRQRRNI
jgi:hypothetical protein